MLAKALLMNPLTVVVLERKKSTTEHFRSLTSHGNVEDFFENTPECTPSLRKIARNPQGVGIYYTSQADAKTENTSSFRYLRGR